MKKIITFVAMQYQENWQQSVIVDRTDNVIDDIISLTELINIWETDRPRLWVQTERQTDLGSEFRLQCGRLTARHVILSLQSRHFRLQTWLHLSRHTAPQFTLNTETSSQSQSVWQLWKNFGQNYKLLQIKEFITSTTTHHFIAFYPGQLRRASKNIHAHSLPIFVDITQYL